VHGIWLDCHTNGEFGKDGGYQPFIGNQLTAAKAFKNQLENTDSSNAPKWRKVE